MAQVPPPYEILIYWSNEDATFVAEVPDLPGCAADGATLAEAASNLEIVIHEWIDTANELRREIPVPRGHKAN